MDIFAQMIKQSSKITLIPKNDGCFEIECETKLSDKEKKYDATVTFPRVELSLSGTVKSEDGELWYVKVWIKPDETLISCG